ncbi:MAG: hypothetical protein AABZ47_07810 [Planctomycetota bacterium]
MAILILHAMLWLGAVASAEAGDPRGLIEQALNEPGRITLESVKLQEAIDQITTQTGVRIALSAEVLALAPYGADTVIKKVQIADVSLRQGLTQLFSPLGMMFVVEENHVRVVPKEAIACLGRAPTWDELDFLSRLSDMKLGTDATALAGLQDRVQFQLAVADSWTLLSDAIRGVGAGAGDEVLTIACDNLGWSWCLSGNGIVVAPRERQLQRLLQQPISLRVSNRPLFDVMAAVSERIGVPIRTEPGALASLPSQLQRNFSLTVHDQPAEQVLEWLAAHTGLGYLLNSEGVLFYQPTTRLVASEQGLKPATAGTSDPYVGKMVVDLGGGKSVEWLFRASELPDDLRAMRERDLQEAFEALRVKLAVPEPQ